MLRLGQLCAKRIPSLATHIGVHIADLLYSILETEP